MKGDKIKIIAQNNRDELQYEIRNYLNSGFKMHGVLFLKDNGYFYQYMIKAADGSTSNIKGKNFKIIAEFCRDQLQSVIQLELDAGWELYGNPILKHSKGCIYQYMIRLEEDQFINK